MKSVVLNMEQDKRVIQAEEMLKELEEPYKPSDLIGGFTTILLGCLILQDGIGKYNE